MEPSLTSPQHTSDLVIVANRLPIHTETLPDGTVQWKHSPGGLVTALEPLLSHRHGTWVGWPGNIQDNTAIHDEIIRDDGLRLYSVRLDAEDIASYYEGFSNATLWPLYHDVIVQPRYHRHWWERYVLVNQRFAQAAADVAAPGAIIWVQDYQLQLVPQLLRHLRHDVTIGFFLHIPFPPIELYMQLPWRSEIIYGLLGADLVGFHLPGDARNFLFLAKQLAHATISRRNVGIRRQLGEVSFDSRKIRVGAFPISIDARTINRAARSRAIRHRAKQIRADLGNPRILMLGVDRLDYTKGINVRLEAVHELLEEKRIDPHDTVFLQLATPSRERVESYQILREKIEHKISHINGDYGSVGHPVIHYLHQPIPHDELLAFFVAADIMLVTPLRDGMNLVAKEYVACRYDGTGALVLSEFTGAAAELTQAYLVNPYDLEGVKAQIMAALTQDPQEGYRRMRAMRRQVLTHTVDQWSHSFLSALSHPNNKTH